MGAWACGSSPHLNPNPNQVILTIAGLEHASECSDPAGHYTKGGEPGNLKFLKNCAPRLPRPPPPRTLGVSPILGVDLMREVHQCLFCGATFSAATPRTHAF